MRSPFPGMDPWLELRWRDVHARLIIYIANQLQGQLPEPLVARAEEGVSVDIEEETAGRVRPDVEVAEDQFHRSKTGSIATLAPPVAIDEPLLLRVPEPEVDRWVAVIDEAYETGRYDRTDYRRVIGPLLPPEEAAWATDLLRKAGRLS